MTNEELLMCQSGDPVLYHGKRYKICHVKQVRHASDELVEAKIRNGDSIVYMALAHDLERMEKNGAL